LDQIRSSVFFDFVRPSSNPSLLLRGSLTLGEFRIRFDQFVWLRFSSFLDLPSPFSTAFDDEERIGDGERIDDQEQIGNNGE
jgi:hypothetical protein